MAKIDLKLVTKLREKTGVGMMDCKKALEEAEGDIEKAIDFLRKKGAKLAEKRAGADTSNGRIDSYIHPGARVGVLVEINCETDFAANTRDLEEFARNICMHIAAANPLYVSPDDVDASLIAKEKEIAREQLKEAGKTDDIINKIIEGKMKKFSGEVSLLTQSYIKNDKITVHDYLNEVIAKIGENIKIRRFARYQLGE